MNALVLFDPITVQMAEYKAENERLVFNYEDPQGNKDARSHIFKLRKVKTKIADAHKKGKAEALAACREIDEYKNKLIIDMDEMIAVHNEPLLLIEKERADAEAEVLRKNEEARAKIEAERLAELEAREAAVRAAEEKAAAEKAEREAEEKERRDEAERIEREKRIAEEAKAKAESDARKALEDAERRRLADIEAVKAKAKADADAKELAERRRLEIEEANRKTFEAAENKRKENEEHQIKVRSEIRGSLIYHGLSDEDATRLLGALIVGTVMHIRIEY